MQDWAKKTALWLAAAQLGDAVANQLVSRRFLTDHLDHLGVPTAARPVLPAIKVAGSVGLLTGLRLPRLGAATSLGLVAYYAAAVVFHVRAGDHPILCIPAAAFGGAAAVTCACVYLPAAR